MSLKYFCFPCEQSAGLVDLAGILEILVRDAGDRLDPLIHDEECTLLIPDGGDQLVGDRADLVGEMA